MKQIMLIELLLKEGTGGETRLGTYLVHYAWMI